MLADAVLSQDPAMSGNDPEEGIVALQWLESHEGGDEIVIYTRSGGRSASRRESFRPFIAGDRDVLKSCPGCEGVEELSGHGSINAVGFFRTWKECVKGRQWLSGQVPYLFLSDQIQQHLTITGRTLFKGMLFHDLRRMQIDIETITTEGYEFCNAERTGDRIVAIGLGDETGWYEVLSDDTMDEKALLEKLVEVIRKRDPDIIEGHNIFNFDLPYIAERARRHKVKLTIGRDGSVPARRKSRVSIAERTISYERFDIAGRHIVDTLFLLHAYDITHRSLNGFGLKEAAIHFGLAAPGRTYIEGSEISAEYSRNPDRVRRYVKDDVYETGKLSELLSPSSFIQTRLLPFSYQNACVKGNATKIDALLVREYLRCRKAMPEPSVIGEYAGGYTDIFQEGVIRNVHHCDVRSLYPSLMLTRKIGPATDSLGVFLLLLGRLRDMRIAAKKAWQCSGDNAEKNYYDALQSTLKVLINSFYGYLGFSQGQFGDAQAAAAVTSAGRDVLSAMLAWLREHGASPVELDTDGIYFVPPPAIDADPEKLDKFRREFAGSLPAGVDIEFDGEFVSMFSYKMKNYALLSSNGDVVIKGAALKSRGLEPFLRRFMVRLIRLKLEEKDAEIPALKAEFEQAVSGRKWGIRELAKTEILQDSLSTYRSKIQKSSRARSAVYELAIRSGREYRQGDTISYYVAGNAKRVTVFEHARLVSEWNPAVRDENISYYLGKLKALYEKFAADAANSELDLPGMEA
jgi:DNA polymerase, archaea type